MMKYPYNTGLLAVLLAGILLSFFAPNSANARIGERKESIERRLFSSGGIVYRDDATETNRQKGMPYLKYSELFPDSATIRIYFKTSDGRRPTSSELEEKRLSSGWDLHVVYVSGKSVLEVYKRSHGLSEYEFNQLMAIHARGSFWKRVTKEEKADMVSAFGFDMVRDDGQVRAKKIGGDAVMFFDSEMDIGLAEMNTTDQQEKAPVSVDGF